MLSFKTFQGRFNYRAAAIILHNNHVLLHKAQKDKFWSLPGGRVDMLEPSSQTLKRELLEEFDLEVRVERLLWVVENFFFYDNEEYHELGFYYLVQADSSADIFDLNKTYRGLEGDAVELSFRWFAVSALEQERVYPSFLKTDLAALPDHTVHVVHYDT